MTAETKQRTCPEHGEFQAKHLFGNHWTSCPQCDQLIEERRARRLEEERQARRLTTQRHWLACSGIAPRFEAGFASFQAKTAAQRAALAACRKFAEDFREDQGSGLFLLGPPGAGKTTLASGIVADVIERHTLRAEICTARAIVRRLRASWARGAAETEDAVFEDLAGLALLVIDEVSGGTTDMEVQQLGELIDLRYARRAPTVVCSNLPAALLQQAIGDRAFDRLAEGVVTVVCDWASFRRAA